MTKKFSTGIFLNILTIDKEKWLKDINFIKTICGLDHIEIWSESDLSSDDIDWLKKQLSSYKLIVHGPFTALSLVSGHESINQTSIDIYKKFIDQAVSLNAKIMTVHTGKHPVYSNPQRATETFTKNFQKLLNHAGSNIILTTENMPVSRGAENHFPLLEELNKFYKLIPDINYTLDIGHCLQNGEDYFQFIKDNKDRIKNIHLHNGIKNGKAHYGLHLSGDLDIKYLINLLNEIGYSNYLTLEVLIDEDKFESIKLLNTL